jgi:SSS family transporter
MNTIDYVIIAAYLLGLLSMGFVLKNQSSEKDYFLGGRTLGWKPLTLSVMATQLSAVSFISAPAFVGLREGGGLIWLSYELALPLAMMLLLGTLLPFFHRLGVVSIYDYLEMRFGLSSRLLISIVFQVSRAFATGIMVYAISIILQGTMGLVPWQSIALIGIITLIYSLQGGMKAVVYGDAIQMVFIVLGTGLCLIAAVSAIGGWHTFIDNVQADRLLALNTNSFGFDGQGFGFLPMLLGGVVLYASYYGCDQSEAQRSLSAKNTHELRKIIMSACLLRFPITLLYCLVGLVVGTLVITTPSLQAQIPSNNPDWMLPIFIINYLPNGLIGLLIVAIFAAAMSSVSSAINSLSAVSVSDVKRVLNKELTEKQHLSLARITGAFWGTLTLVLSFFAGDIAPTVIEAINKIGSVFYGPILACFLLGVTTRYVSAFAVNLGVISGVLVNAYLWLFAEQIFWFWWNVAGFFVATSVALVCSSIIKRKQPNKNLLSNFHSILQMKHVLILLAWFAFITLTCVLFNLNTK